MSHFIETNKLLVSIIVPVYNVEQYLRRCIDSLINQTYQHLEIILVDDGSPDRCGEICDEYAKQDSRIEVFHKENGGLSDARNKGLDVATGDYVMFVDSDDWIEKETCEILIKNIKRYKVDVVSFGIQLVGDNRIYEIQKVNSCKFLSPSKAVEAMIYRQKEEGLLNYVCNKIFKKSLFDNIRFPTGKLFEDQDVTYKLLHNASSIYAINEVYYNYYQRGNSIMAGFYRPKALHDRITIWLKRYAFLCKYYPELSKYQLAQVLGDIYVAIIRLHQNTDYQDFQESIKTFAYNHRHSEKTLVLFNKKVMLHYYCYPVFWIYVKCLLKRK